MAILRRPTKGVRSSSVHMMPETDGLSKLPDQPINVQRSRSEVGAKVNTMKERNKVVSPTSNPASAPPHLQRTAHPVIGRKRKFQQGGLIPSANKFLQPLSSKLPAGVAYPRTTKSSELASSVGGENGEPAYLIPTFKGGRTLQDPVGEYKRTGEHLGGPFDTWKEADTWDREVRHPYVEKGQNIPTPLKTWGSHREGELPNSVPQEVVDAKIKAWRQSPEWYEQASGRADVTDSPIDYLMLGPAEATGKLLWKTAAAASNPIAKSAVLTLGSLGSMGYMDLNGTEAKAADAKRDKIRSIFNSAKK